MRTSIDWFRSVLPAALSLVLLASVSFSQVAGGSVQTFGTSCPAGGTPCFQSNPGGGTLTNTQVFSGNLFAFPFVTTSTTVVVGCEFYMRALGNPTTMGVYLFDSDVWGRPNGFNAGFGTVVGALSQATLSLGTSPGWYQAVFPAPVVLEAGHTYFLSYISNSNAFMMPIVSPGSPSTHFFLPAGSTFWSGPFVTQNWAWKVLCAPPGTPALDFTLNAPPAPGQSLAVGLANATPNAPAYLLIGLSNQSYGPYQLPLDLSIFGIPSCNLYVSIDAMIPALSDASGSASMPFQIPWSSALIGAVFHAQWVVSSPTASGGIALSNGGTVTIGP